DLTPDTLSARLRDGEPPIIPRIAGDHVLLDPRTIFPEQLETVAGAVRAALDA
ncbi:MAG: L-seryl-tRNA(Sec) selenium transferase, partial [Gemmatimonadetes bacterium]